MSKSKGKQSEEEDKRTPTETMIGSQAEILNRIYEAISKKLPRQDDRELLKTLIDAMKKGGSDEAEKNIGNLISQLSGEE